MSKSKIEKEIEKNEKKIFTCNVEIRALTMKGELILKDVKKFQSSKFIKERRDMYDTEKEKDKVEKEIGKRLIKIKEKGIDVRDKIKKLISKIEELKEENKKLNKKL